MYRVIPCLQGHKSFWEHSLLPRTLARNLSWLKEVDMLLACWLTRKGSLGQKHELLLP